MNKPSSLRSRIIVIALGIALGVLAKAVFKADQDVAESIQVPTSSTHIVNRC